MKLCIESDVEVEHTQCLHQENKPVKVTVSICQFALFVFQNFVHEISGPYGVPDSKVEQRVIGLVQICTFFKHIYLQSAHAHSSSFRWVYPRLNIYSAVKGL